MASSSKTYFFFLLLFLAVDVKALLSLQKPLLSLVSYQASLIPTLLTQKKKPCPTQP